ncbi:MAG: nucleotidyltransferase family protein [Elusimicrobia bacterium]|nr:nucleotidyltransferase family protein [Elusimicrobiota bacterium]
MVLAAGIGSRLGPLTRDCPKALLEIGGRPMLEIVIRRLIEAGVSEIIVNVFHLAEQIAEFIEKRGRFGIRIELSREDQLLDTGGGLKKAAWFFDDGEPFFLHNSDVLTDLDLARMLRFHKAHPALATLAVQRRESARALLFGADGALKGWKSGPQATRWASRPDPKAEALAFAGIHVISPRLLERLSETGAFPVHQAYLRLASEGERIQAFPTDGCYWTDIGTEAKLSEARARAQDPKPFH